MKIKPVEIIVTYISLGWAFVLLTTPGLFDTSLGFKTIKEIVNYEWVVGLAALACAVVKIIGMIFNHRRIRWFGLVMSTIFWVIVASSFVMVKGTLFVNTGFIVYSGIAVLSLWTSKEVMGVDGAEQRRVGGAD